MKGGQCPAHAWKPQAIWLSTRLQVQPRASNSDNGKGRGHGARSRMSNRHCRDGRGLQTTALLLTVSVKGRLLGRERAPRHHVPAASRLFTRICLLLLAVYKADATPLHGRQAGSEPPGDLLQIAEAAAPAHISAGPSQGHSLPPRRRCPRSPQAAHRAAFLEVAPTLGVPPVENHPPHNQSGGACQAGCSPPDLGNLFHSHPLRQASQGALGEVPGKQLSLLTWWRRLISPLSKDKKR